MRNPDGDAIGRARDVVVRLRPSGAPSRALGLVLQLTDKRRVFVPMGRITAIEPNEILLNSGLVSMRQFKARPGESTVLGDLVGSKVQIDDPDLEHLHGVPQEEEATAILTAIIELASALGMRAVAEGVETEAQRSMLIDFGCCRAQGFLLGRPEPADAFARRLVD